MPSAWSVVAIDSAGSVTVPVRARMASTDSGTTNRLVVHLVGEVGLVAVDGHDVLPDGDLPHVAARAAEVLHQFDGVERDQAVGHGDEGDPRRRAQRVEDLVAGRDTGQLQGPVVVVGLGVSGLAAIVTTSRSGRTVCASGPWWEGIAASGTTVFMTPPRWNSHWSVARRIDTPRARASKSASASAPSTRIVEVVLHDTARVASRPAALA